MTTYECPKCKQRVRVYVALTEPPVCNRKDRRVTHPARMVPLVKPQRA